jgi:hypothetical protein
MRYITRQIEVDAWRIEEVSGGQQAPGNPAALLLEDGRVVEVASDMTARMWPAPGDYLVQAPQPNVVYLSLNPKAVFESRYMTIQQGPTTEDDAPVPAHQG